MKVASAVLALCLLALLTLTLASEEEDCLKMHNVTRSQVEAVTPNTPLDDIPSNIKCFSHCVIHDYFGSDGKIDLKLVGNRASAQEQQILGECKQQNDDDINDLDKCDYAYLMLQCLFLGKASGLLIE